MNLRFTAYQFKTTQPLDFSDPLGFAPHLPSAYFSIEFAIRQAQAVVETWRLLIPHLLTASLDSFEDQMQSRYFALQWMEGVTLPLVYADFCLYEYARRGERFYVHHYQLLLKSIRRDLSFPALLQAAWDQYTRADYEPSVPLIEQATHALCSLYGMEALRIADVLDCPYSDRVIANLINQICADIDKTGWGLRAWGKAFPVGRGDRYQSSIWGLWEDPFDRLIAELRRLAPSQIFR